MKMRNPSPTRLGYRDIAGARHRVLVRQSPDGAWQVLDVIVIETLTGFDEGREAAEAIAREYVAQRNQATASHRMTRRAAA
jgi:hypothetical protein